MGYSVLGYNNLNYIAERKTMEPKIDTHLTPAQLEIVQALTSPAKIQAFLDSVTYSPEDTTRCPVQVLQDRLAHCMDGGLFAAAMMRRLGYPPLVVDIFPDPGMDDDHVLAVYRREGYFGALAKSNYVGLRYREPVYRSLRELVMSYFEDFYSVDGIKTLRSYTPTLNLARFDRLEWMWRNDYLEQIMNHMDHRMRRYRVVTPEMAGWLSPIDRRSYEAGMQGVNPDGLYIPGKSHQP
jgi:hypothetical protein